MDNTEKPTIISIESHGKKFTAELPWDVNMSDLMDALKGLLLASGWPIDIINEYVKSDLDE